MRPFGGVLCDDVGRADAWVQDEAQDQLQVQVGGNAGLYAHRKRPRSEDRGLEYNVVKG